MKLILSDGRQLDLPTYKDEEKTLLMLKEDRLLLVNSILKEFPEEFGYDEQMFYKKYGKKQDANRLTKVKLDILATYLIKSDTDYTQDVMSRYKEKARPLQEVSFSQLNDSVIEICGLY